MTERKNAIDSLNSSEKERVNYFEKNMSENAVFKFSREKSDKSLIELKFKYLNYRKNWKEQPKKIIKKK